MTQSETLQERSAPRIIRTYPEARAVMRSPAFENAGFDGADVIMGRTLPALSGDEHGTRRRQEMPLFRPDKVHDYESRVLPAAMTMLWEHIARDGEAGGIVRLDLVWWAQMTMIGVVAEMIGFDQLDAPRTQRLYDIQKRIAEIAGPGAHPDARERTRDAAATMEDLRLEFVEPALNHRRTLAAEGGPQAAQDLLSILATAGYEDDLVLREVVPFLVGARTPGRSTVQTFLNLDRWFAQHPEDLDLRLDPEFLLRASVETIRLSPPAVLLRRALYDVTLGDLEFRRGDVVAIDHAAANYDTAALGQGVGDFDPRRDLGPHRFATSFGAGRHLCIGRPLTVRDRETDASFGVQPRMLEWLFREGVELDPDEPPVWKSDLRYVEGLGDPVVEHEVLVRCPAVVARQVAAPAACGRPS